MLISTALLLDSIIRNSVCTPAKLPCRRVEVGYEENISIDITFKDIDCGIFLITTLRGSIQSVPELVNQI
jgi:hypothetical protein